MTNSAILDYLMGSFLGAAVALLGTHAVLTHIEAQDVAPKAEVAVEAPESPVEAAEPEDVLSDPPAREIPKAPRPVRRRRQQRAVKAINLESDDPLEGI